MTGGSEPTPPAGEPVVFDALLHPHRSLGPAGFTVLMGVAGALGFVAGLAFYRIGAWPVAGFCGAEIALLYVMFRLNYRAARGFERVRLTRSELSVERHDWRGHVRRWSFQPYWLRVAVAPGGERLVLRSHGRALAIGGFLSPAERADFARALAGALDETRTARP